MFFLLNLPSDAQNYIRLSDGSIQQGTILDTLKRSIEYLDNGILVTYQFDYVLMEGDPLFPSANLLLLNGFGIREGMGIPALPIKLDRFAIPTDTYQVSVVDSSYTDFSMEISPARPPVPNSSSPVFTHENVKPIVPYTGIYPTNIVLPNLYKYKADAILDICINPIQYDYHSKTTRIYQKISYLVNYGSTSNNSGKMSMGEKQEDSFLTNIIMNPSSKTARDVSANTTSQITPPGYLIITVPQYAEAVSLLADWKRTLGYNVKITSNTNWNETSVKDSIVSINNNTPLSYLLIVGDFEDVPGKAVSDSAFTTTGWQYYHYYTDYYYGCIHQNTYPEIHRGRISVSSDTEAMTVIEKVIQYEKEPVIDSLFYKTGINCAYFQDNYHYDNNWNMVPSKDSVEDVRFTLTSENIRDYLVCEQEKVVNRVYSANETVIPYYWNNYKYGYFKQKKLIPEELRRSNGFQWNGGPNDITNYINNGAFYVLHRDHGSIQFWSNPNLGFSDINSMSNGRKLPVVFSMNCLTGRYSGNTCFAEKFLRKENGGCVAIFAASETSFSGYNDALTLGMFDAIWPYPGFVKSFPHGSSILSLSTTPTYKLGDILDIGLLEISTIYTYSSYSILKHTKEIFHCFGDPAMEIYTDIPTPFDTLSVIKSNQTISVSLTKEATITFYNLSSGLVESYKGLNVSYPYSSNLRICISAHNKIPVIMDSNNLYIQNETIASSVNYEADTIKVGSNVTTLKTPGEVIVVGGTTKLKGKNIELSNGTTVALGAKLEITN